MENSSLLPAIVLLGSSNKCSDAVKDSVILNGFDWTVTPATVQGSHILLHELVNIPSVFKRYFH
jgi:hypothetical protein